MVLGLLAERRFGRLSLFVNAENLTNVRQSTWESLLGPERAVDGRWTVDAWAPLDGRVINGGIRVSFSRGAPIAPRRSLALRRRSGRPDPSISSGSSRARSRDERSRGTRAAPCAAWPCLQELSLFAHVVASKHGYTYSAMRGDATR